MKRRRRVAITGLGVVAPNGIGRQAFWEALIGGQSGIGWIESFDPAPFPCKVAGEVRDFQAGDFMSRKIAREVWRFTQFAVAASRMALDDSKLDLARTPRDRIGACFGTCLNGTGQFSDCHEALKGTGVRGLDPFTCIEYSNHAPVSYVTIELGLRGSAMTLASGCSTGLDVIKWGHDQIVEGAATAVIAGGTEAPLMPLPFATFCAVGVLSTANWMDPRVASRPYDLHRDGLVLAEGAGAVVLEEMDHALDRGAKVFAEVVGFATASEALHARKVDLEGETLARTIKLALTGARLRPQDIDYISAHGNSMPDYDIAETNAFKRAFGNHAYSIPISSIKSMIGQPIAASGILQAVSTALTLTEGIIPPTINLTTRDPRCDLDYVPNTSRSARVKVALANAHSVGGTHSVLVLKHPHPA